ncbi:MAG: hypothetical protein HFH84_05155 [Lachnospiraceae bacterium]|nr:hypothetical protein [Lachnospiraceae bacterium]
MVNRQKLNAVSTAWCGGLAEECKKKARTYEACPDVLAFEYSFAEWKSVRA